MLHREALRSREVPTAALVIAGHPPGRFLSESAQQAATAQRHRSDPCLCGTCLQKEGKRHEPHRVCKCHHRPQGC
ncbi:hypothetical protein RA210_U10101 [Rubrivivax sp. A210]|nr:hypothetical protein RA210_U10101 [Rubrivivax sp. A210]